MSETNDNDGKEVTDVQALLDALDEAAAERQAAGERRADASRKCRELVVRLMQLGVKRDELTGRPFSAAALTEIRREAGLLKPHRPRRRRR